MVLNSYVIRALEKKNFLRNFRLFRFLIVHHFGGFWSYSFIDNFSDFQRYVLFAGLFIYNMCLYKLGESLNSWLWGTRANTKCECLDQE